MNHIRPAASLRKRSPSQVCHPEAVIIGRMPYSGEMSFRDCPHCGLHDAQMKVLGEDMVASRLGQKYLLWSVLSCPRCGGAILLETSDHDFGGNVVMRVVPSGAIEEIHDLPDDVAEYYRAAVTVLQAGVPDAAAVQLRRTLEAAAAHHGITSGPLVQRIRGLIKKGLITTDFAGVLNHVREVGNVGAHAGSRRVDQLTAERALRFTTQVLRNLFEIPAELARLKAPPPVDSGDSAGPDPSITPRILSAKSVGGGRAGRSER